VNTGTFAGHLGRDAETRQTGSGSVTNFSVAVQVGWGENKRTLWVGCAMWGERGEKVAQYLTKGTPVTVSGDIDLRQFDKKDGTAGAEITCNVQRLTLQGAKGDRSERQDAAAPAAGKRTSAEVADDFDGDSALPF